MNSVIYDTGMLIGLADAKAGARTEHTGIVGLTRPVIPGPVLAQAWRSSPATRRTLSWYIKDCELITTYTIDDYKRAGVMMGNVYLPGKKRPDVVDALVALTAAKRVPSIVLTSDVADISACLDTLPKASVDVRSV